MSTGQDLRGAVLEALTADQMIDTDDIEVDVQQSSVLLNGTVPSQAQVAEATKAASKVQGVGAVYNLLDVAQPSQEYGDDAALAATANQALTAEPAVPPGVLATSRLGNITLTGTVSTAGQRSAAEDTVAGVGGVLSISNKIAVVPAGPTAPL
jgi:osmotically-inducible protein OsmY